MLMRKHAPNLLRGAVLETTMMQSIVSVNIRSLSPVNYDTFFCTPFTTILMPKHTHTHPLKLIEKPAALVPAPRVNLVGYSGVLTPSDNGKELSSRESKFLPCLVLRKADD